MPGREPDVGRSYELIRLALAACFVAVLTGAGGTALALLLHAIQHWTYGYSRHELMGAESFLQGVEAASWKVRVIAMLAAGAIGGIGWRFLARQGCPLLSVKQAVANGGAGMPFLGTVVNAILQIVTVALGSPLGREVAPREIGALTGAILGRLFAVSSESRRILVASAAGAGLAAVYNVPLGGAVFTLEVRLGTFELRAVAISFFVSAIAATVAATVLGSDVQYAAPAFAGTWQLCGWAVLFGPLIGVVAQWYIEMTTAAKATAYKGRYMPVAFLAAFALVGILAIPMPGLLGNGKGPAQLALEGAISSSGACMLVLLKLLATYLVLKVGAKGGLMTPAIALGALLGLLLGQTWSAVFPGAPAGAYALIGAAAFLSTSMRMPLTALLLIAEFTRMDSRFYPALLIATVGSVLSSRAYTTWKPRPTQVAPAAESYTAAAKNLGEP